MIEEVLAVCKRVGFRDPLEVISKLMEEVGELSQEVGIAVGFQQRPMGKDGVLGETADVIITAIDVLYRTSPQSTAEDLSKAIALKLESWERKDKLYPRTSTINMKVIDMNDMPEEIIPNQWYEKGEDIYFTHNHELNEWHNEKDKALYEYICVNFPDIKDGSTIMIEGLY